MQRNQFVTRYAQQSPIRVLPKDHQIVFVPEHPGIKRLKEFGGFRCLWFLCVMLSKYMQFSYTLPSMVVGVGYHHPPVQWPSRLMDERQRGNLAAVAGQGGFGFLGFLCPAQPDTLVLLAMVVKAAGYIMHAEFVLCHTVGTAYSDASSHSLLRVDAVCAMRTIFD